MGVRFETITGFFDGIMPIENLLPSEWADKYRFLSSAASAEPGRWRTSRTPYLREIMDRFSPLDPCQEISVIKGAQLGFTEAGFNILGYFISQDPCPIMYIMPTVETIKRNSKMRIAPMIESTPKLAERIGPAKKKDSGNSMFQKDFPGGTLILSGANSAATLRSVPIKLMIMDEVDAYPLDLEGEGSPVDLAKARTRTFAKKKIMYFSTPLIHGQSVVESNFLESSQRRFFVPCPLCGFMQDLKFSNLKYTKNKKGDKAINAVYHCDDCAGEIEEHHKTKMLDGGEWRDMAPENKNILSVGYHINSLYSPLGWYSWIETANDWIAAQKNVSKLKVFTNTVLGETWLEKGEVPDWENLFNRRAAYSVNTLNDAICFITVGVDVQKDRLELEVVGWCKGKVSYSIDYRVLMGDTSDKSVWNDLAKVLGESWTRSDGIVIPVRLMAIDSGYNTSEVYGFCRRFHPSQVVPVKGQDKQPVIFTTPRPVDNRNRKNRKHSAKGLALYNIGVSILKQELYGWLGLKIENELIPAGYCFFPENYDANYFKMLTAEELKKTMVKGFPRYEWVNTRGRNEALDCRNYARAAAAICGMDSWQPQHWDALNLSYNEKTSSTRKTKKRSDFWG